jgi:hypothetical protein
MITIKYNTKSLVRLAVVALTAFLAIAIPANNANAAPVAIVNMSTMKPLIGQVVTFNGSASICTLPTGCSYTWQWFWRSADGTTTHVGGQMGRTAVVKYAFNALAAAKPYVIVQLKVGEGRVRKFSTANVAFKVLPK